MNKLTAAIIGASMTAGVASVHAEDIGGGFDLSMNAALATDYVWRGVSQTQGKGAVQGGMDIGHSSGVYAGVWASNVDFDSNASSEWDFYAGYGGDVGAVSYDVGYLAYTYVDESSLNFSEYYASVGVIGITFGVNYSDDSSTESDQNDSTTYMYLSYETELPGGVGLSATYGQYDYKDDVFTNDSGSTSSKYDNYLIGANYTAVGVDWGLTYTDTNLSGSECEDFAGKDDFCDGIFSLSASKSF